MAKKRVLIVDDSALVRKQLGELLEKNGYEIDFAKNGKIALQKAVESDFNVITMDINMPVMDGITSLEEIMKQNPTPVIMVSSLVSADAEPTMKAFELGAIDCVAKPGTSNVGLKDNGDELLKLIKSASRISKRRMVKTASNLQKKPIKRVSKEVNQKRHTKKEPASSIVLIGSSTGGPSILEELCSVLPADFPHAVSIVQHMPEKFISAFAQRLDRVSNLEVKEAEHNEELYSGVVYVAKGGIHMHFRKKVSGKIVIRLEESAVSRFFTPSVDEMYFSALEVFKPKDMFAIILTGIGDDGADGMVALKKAGVHTIGESEETATVYGMPKEAYLRGGVSEKLPFDKILQRIRTYR